MMLGSLAVSYLDARGDEIVTPAQRRDPRLDRA
jgi:hypothetical protein